MTLYIVLAAGVLVAAAVTALTVGLRRARQDETVLEERLESWVGQERPQDGAGRRGGWRGTGQSKDPWAPPGRGAKIRQELARADLTLTVTEWLAIRAGVVVLFFLVGYLAQGLLLLGLVLGVVGYFAPTLYLRVRQARRLQAFNRQLPDVLDQLVGSLRVGYGLSQSIEWVSQQMPAPAGTEFDRVVRELQLGQTLPRALDTMVSRIRSDDLALIVTAIKIQHESGGSLAEILETVAHTIRERVRIQREINVLTAQQRYSGYTMLVLPIALAIFLFMINPEYMSQLWAPGPTLCIPIGTGVMMIVGFFVMRRIVDIEV